MDFFLRWLPDSAFPYPIPHVEEEEATGVYQSHRRRAMEYTTWMDATSVVGYMIRSPLSGHNYAYRARVKTWNAEKLAQAYEGAFVSGALWTALGVIYLRVGWNWRLAMWVLGLSMGATEGLSLVSDVAFRQLCPEDDVKKFQQTVQKFVDQNVGNFKEQAEFYGGDVEFLAGKIHHTYWVDKIPRLQGISLVYSATGAAALHRLLLRGGYKQSWLNIILGVAAAYPVYVITREYIKTGNKTLAGGEQVSHTAHALGALIGTAVSWWKP